MQYLNAYLGFKGGDLIASGTPAHYTKPLLNFAVKNANFFHIFMVFLLFPGLHFLMMNLILLMESYL